MFTNQTVEKQMEFFRVGKNTPTSNFKTNESWRIRISWSYFTKSPSMISDFMDVFWRVSILLEPLGMEGVAEFTISELDIPFESGSRSTPSDLISYKASIDIPSGEVPAGLYTPVAVIVLNNKNNTPMQVAGFIKSTPVRFQDPDEKIEPQLFKSAHSGVDEFILIIEEEKKLTVHYLTKEVIPYLNAIADLQGFINRVRGLNSVDINIISISHQSPISISLEGASDALQVIKDSVVPWRRKHSEIMAKLKEQEQLVEIENVRAEVLEKRARAEKDRIEATIKREKVERLRIENDKSRLELQRAKVQLSIDILNQVVPNLSETERILYISRLLPSLEILISSDLAIG